MAGGSTYVLYVLTWVSDAEVSMCGVRRTHAQYQGVLYTTESDLRLSHHLLYLPIAADKRPSNVSIEATPFSVFIEWMEHSDNIPFVTGYNITMKNMVTKATRTVYVEGGSRKANVTGLTPFTEYSFTVRAEYKYGAGPPSETMTQRTREHGK